MKFVYDIADNGHNKMTFDYDEEARERLEAKIEGDNVVLYANKEGMVTLAKTLLKMAHGSYSNGFHVHLRKDFDASNPETIAIVLATDAE